MNIIVKILMERDELTLAEAQEEFQAAVDRVSEGEDPEEVLHDLGLEPDYFFDLIPL